MDMSADANSRCEADQLENAAFEKIVNCFRCYRIDFFKRLQAKLKSFASLLQVHKALLPTYLNHLDGLRHCAIHNYEVIKVMLEDVGYIFVNVSHPELSSENWEKESSKSKDTTCDANSCVLKEKPIKTASQFDIDKLHGTLRQFSRDWGDEGVAERKACYTPVINEVLSRYNDFAMRPSVRILVPGAGLGRLAFEFARLGFESQGNEFSYFMLIASNFLLNRCKIPYQYTIYPWIHQTTNHMSNEDQLRPVKFPDVSPKDLPDGSNFSMAAGDFVEVKTNSELVYVYII